MVGKLTLIIGLAVLIVVGLACGAEEKQDPTNAGLASDTQQAQNQPRPSGLPVENTSPVPTGGGAPRIILNYEGTVYVGDSLSTDEKANLNEDDLELVGSSTNVPGSGASTKVYRFKDGGEGDIYTMESGQSFKNEDGRTITIDAEWVRWRSCLIQFNSTCKFWDDRTPPTCAEEVVAQADADAVGTVGHILMKARLEVTSPSRLP